IIIPPDRVDEEQRILERLRRGERIPPFETVRVTKDGRRLDIALTISPVRDRTGRVIGTAKVARDITAQKQAARALRLSEERARLALEIAHLGTWSWDMESGAITADDRCREICGLPPVGELAPGDIRARIHPDDVERIERAFAAVAAAEAQRPIAAELRVVHGDGSVRWVASRCRKIAQSEGSDAPVTVIGTVGDITGQKSAENALRATAERLTLAMTAASLGDWSWDATTDVVTYSQRAAEIVGVSPRLQVPYADIDALLHVDDRARVRRELERALVEGSQFDLECRIVRPDRGEVWVSARGRAHQEGGRAAGIYGVLQDITDRKRLEHELRDRAEALSDADRKKDEFLATLAHELRNPLAPLRNGLQVMRLAGTDAVRVGRAWAMMDRQLSHMVRLIDDLLDVSRISRNRLELRRTRVTLAEVVSSAVETARPVIEAARHELVVSLPTTPVFLYADLTRLAQVLSNLLTNSAKYTEPGGWIHLTAEQGGDEVVIAVADNGIGIPVRALPTIFDMFSQVDRGGERAAGGLGIGLALVKR
ncbi:MAG TPA: PAS domain-containing protein, partial [Nannocystis sp.]